MMAAQSQRRRTLGENAYSSMAQPQAIKEEEEEEEETEEDGMRCMIGFLVSRATSAAWQRMKRDKLMDDSQLVTFLLKCYEDLLHQAVCPVCQTKLQRFCTSCSTVFGKLSEKFSDSTATLVFKHSTTVTSGKERAESEAQHTNNPTTRSTHKPAHTFTRIKTRFAHSSSHSKRKQKDNATCKYSDSSLTQANVYLDVDEPYTEWNFQENTHNSEDSVTGEDHLGITERENTTETEDSPSHLRVTSSDRPSHLRVTSSDRPSHLRVTSRENVKWKDETGTMQENEVRLKNKKDEAVSCNAKTSEQNVDIGKGFRYEIKTDVHVTKEPQQSDSMTKPTKFALTKPDTMMCTWCEECFQTVAALTKHLTVHTTTAWQSKHLSVSHRNKAGSHLQSVNSTKHNCKIKPNTRHGRVTRCRTTALHLQSDAESKHSRENSSASRSRMLRYHCLQCGEGAKTPVGLTFHIQCTHVSKNTYRCLLCRKTFKSVRSIAHHMRLHPSQRGRDKDRLDKDPATHPHQCGQCGKRFMFMGNLANHVQRHSGQSQVWSCSHCQGQFPSMTELTSHQCPLSRVQQQEAQESSQQQTDRQAGGGPPPGSRNSQPASAPNSGQRVSTNSGTEAVSVPHSQKDTSEGLKSTTLCCRASSGTVSKVQEQASESQPAIDVQRKEQGEKGAENKPVNEKPVKKKGRKPKNALTGMKEVRRPYKCSECSATFQHASVLKLHSQKHSGEKAFPCYQCQQSFRSKTGMLRHQEKDHWQGMPITCHQCGKVFSTARGLDEHSVFHTGERPYVCETCGEAFPYRTALTRHRRTHRASYFKCKDCGAEFHLKSLYNNHVDERHRAVKPHLCSDCGQAFSTLSMLKRHVDVHGKKQFVCELCGKEFRKRGEHKMHLLTHQSVKPYPCSLCDRSFVSRCKLKLHHTMTHLGIKPFPCKQCPATFSCATYLSDHVRLAHTTERQFACPLCLSRFAAKRFLNLHLRRTHKTNKVEVKDAESLNLSMMETTQLPHRT